MALPFATLAAGAADVGGFLSGASSLLGAFGFGSKKKKGPSPEEQIALNKMAQTAEFDTRMELGKKHGIHPLTMIGAPAYSGSGIYMDGSRQEKTIDLNAMGQGIDRLANVGRTQVQRELDDLAIDNAKLSNDYLRVQIAGAQKAVASSGQTPAYSSGAGDYLLDGQSGSGTGRVAPKPAEPTLGATASQPHREGGAYPEIGYKQISPTELRIVPSKDQKERMEDDIFEQFKYHSRHSMPIISNFRNNFVKKPPYPSDVPLPKGFKKWVWAYDRWVASKK